jgi:glycosyltransferase involved in cell wall biosynthesis
MIGILHGYLLEGSGSNLWTRSIIQALCKLGETVHLFGQENHPDIYDFISEAYLYEPDGTVKTLLKRDISYPGICILHKPKLGDILPVFVWDHYEEFANVVPMIELSDQEIENYINRYVTVLTQIIEQYEIKVLHANHAVLMSVIAQRINENLGTPYVIMPHGSAIEYAVKKDKRFFNFAEGAFYQAKKIFVIGPEIQQRVKNLFPSIPHIQNKMTELNLGADTGLFTPINKNERNKNIRKLCSTLERMEKGKTPEMTSRLIENIPQNISQESLLKRIKKNSDYIAKHPDAEVEKKLNSIDWQNENIILFVGRLIASKGLQSVIAALPSILEKAPNSRLVVVGHGPQREILEILINTLIDDNEILFKNILDWGSALEGGAKKPYATYKYFLETQNINDYIKSSQQFLKKDSVVFTGYLTHKELRYLFPCCDVAIFPSVVAEAGPLVFLEALSSGCFPMGTYFAGMAASIDSVAPVLNKDDVKLMKISQNEKETVQNISDNVPKAFALTNKYKSVLRNIAVEKYDWKNVAKRFTSELKSLMS